MDIKNKDGKFVVEIKSTSATTKAPSGSFEAILSVPIVDRDKEVVDSEAFNPLPDHITIDVDHAMTVEKTIGSGRPYYDGPLLRFEGTYASHPLAQMVRSLVDEGHIRTMSVAYMNAFYEVDSNDNFMHLRKAELLNAGIVGIPANREALITASKSLAATVAEVIDAEPVEKYATADASDVAAKSGARHNTHDMALLQSAHDALSALGVECASKSVTPEISTDTTPEVKDAAAADAACSVLPPAAVDVVAMAKARALLVEAGLTLL